MGLLTKILGLGDDAPEALPEQALLLDVRSPAEYASGHIRDAIPIPLSDIAMDIGRVAPEKSAPIIVYCQSGGRSASARQQLLQMGYQNVVNGGGLHTLAGRIGRDIVR